MISNCNQINLNGNANLITQSKFIYLINNFDKRYVQQNVCWNSKILFVLNYKIILHILIII